MSRILTMARAGREALDWEMERRPEIVCLGEDVFKMGGIFGTMDGFGAKYGPERVISTPISETGFIGMAAGAAMAGMHPVVDLAYIDFIGVCYNVLLNCASKTHYMSGGAVKVPMTLLIGTGGGYNNAAQHSQCLHATVAHIPGVKVVYPSNAYDAKGMLHTALRDDNFVIYLTHKGTAGVGWMGPPIPTTLAEVPEEPYTVPFGRVKVYREGTDVTVTGLGMSVHEALKAAAELEKEGISVEVVDLRSLVPLDREGIMESVAKTGRLVVTDEDYLSYGVSGEVIATVAERDPGVFKKPPVRVTMPDIPIPFSRPLEQAVLPLAGRIADAVRRLMS
ncbi:MAG: alpha-ketoacid dehydrogenase subunit beta [Sphingomonadaceae bacterium]|uniref:alpha-ketoacid dehydrogenase subunit beta n=1 Tax=Thermaurantiacus sp. TaxID=2820283 RepID=UPI00298EFE3A|nr:transketolase C-terminal domain-containing protein [Thermaurantiacus sp.]MCS6986961.1 alpha-ketoacid dehydrogenase subunit beta [Sphingomonadaceae bacterium]MDW8415439.1 transketolase C-terminal domain-containing protein [Thermaurantiacus sp.]